MSATVEATRLAAPLDATVIESAGRPFPVTITHAARDLAAPRDLPDAMAGAIRAALAAHPGDILAFLPGMAEIRRTEAGLAGLPAHILPLHGDLPRTAQDAALSLAPGGARRVVLATAIAETSLTVPGVRIVIDGGFRRAPRLDPGSGLARLVTTRVSRASAEQRAGRAGREAPGVAIRLWTAARTAASPPSTGRKSWRRSCPRCASPAPSGPTRSAPRPPTCRSPIPRRRAPSPPPAACSPTLARWIPAARSPRTAGGWPRSARIRGWPQ